MTLPPIDERPDLYDDAERWWEDVVEHRGARGTGEDVLDAFEAALAHEQKVSASIRDLYRLAESEGDLDSRPLLNWFLDEQVEEEATVKEIVGRVKMINDDGPGLLRLDEELGARPVTTTEAR